MKVPIFTGLFLAGLFCCAAELNFSGAQVIQSRDSFQIRQQGKTSSYICVIPLEKIKFLKVEIRDSVLFINTEKFYSNGGKEVFLRQFRHSWKSPGPGNGCFVADLAAAPEGTKIKLVFHGKEFWKEKILSLKNDWQKLELRETYPSGLESVYTRIHLLSPGVYRIRAMSLQENGEKKP